MHEALDAEKEIVALTADVSGFYHELNPGFMLDESFNDLFNLELSEEETKLHRLFITALQAWAQNTPLQKGLPVGLPASAVVANMALFELDRLIERQVVPLFYGRYVDDILLVMENGPGSQSAKSLWEWLFDRSEGMLGWTDKERKDIRFQPSFLKDSQIIFSNKKNKVFLLSGGPGKRLVDSIAKEIHERASEWRALPNLPISPERVGIDLVAATQSDGEAADNLRETDALSMRRAGFAIKLRDYEAYERDLPPAEWQDHRHAFLRAFVEHVLVLPQFFDLANYLPRVLRLATSCEDFDYLRLILDKLDSVCETVKESCTTTIKSCPYGDTRISKTILARWKDQLRTSVEESIIAAFPGRLSRDGKAAWQTHMADCFEGETHTNQVRQFTLADLKAEHARLFSFDLAHTPFRFIGLPKEMVTQRDLPPKKAVIALESPRDWLPKEVTLGVKQLAKWARLKGLPNGLLFATRPFNLTELCLLLNDPFALATRDSLNEVVLALRGFSLNDDMPHWDQQQTLQIPRGDPREKIGITVSSWETHNKTCVASVMRKPDTGLNRYSRLNRLVNTVISQPEDTDYFILPELALPARWFMRLAHKLRGRGISLISGIEYLHARGNKVRNQVWAALTHDGLGFPSLVIYKQDKQRPGLHEERELQRLAGLKLRPVKTWETPPVLQHGDFRFSLLVCSELTNINNRAALRGDVDALFIPEWNQDTGTFNALVESAALDIHAYIIQCNNRRYGDSRIRAPFKESWKRDLLRVKGGIYDYCVTGRIDIQALRRFQSSHRSPDGPFKPVPDGFVIHHSRKTLPVGDPE